MTHSLQRIQSTPMAPYVGLMEKKTNADLIREKYKNLKRSPRVEKLMELRKEAAKYVDLTDERTKHILGLDV